MKIMSSLLVVLILSSKSYAGLFCGDFKCDLDMSNVSKVSHRILKQEEAVTLIDGTNFAINSHDAIEVAKGQALRNPFYSFTHLFDDQIQRHGEFDYEYRNCYAVVDPSPEVNYRNQGANGSYEYKVNVRLTCKKITFDKKNKSELSADLCLKVTECASNIKNSNDIKDYIALKDSICGKNADIVSDENRVESRGRGMSKTLQSVDSGENTIVKASGATLK
jgi:hypothetical protein